MDSRFLRSCEIQEGLRWRLEQRLLGRCRGDDFDINATYPELGVPLLFAAAAVGGIFLDLVLAFPDLDVNIAPNKFTVLHWIVMRRAQSLRTLLRDPRMDLCAEDGAGHTPLELACLFGKVDAVCLLLACDKPQRIRVLGFHDFWDVDNSYFYSKNCSRDPALNGEIRLLTRNYLTMPDICRHRLKVRLGDPGHVGAPLFAMVLLSCDGYMRVPDPAPPATVWNLLVKMQMTGQEKPAAVQLRRLLAISARLPMEVQMTLCNIAGGSSRLSIASGPIDLALRHLIYQNLRDSSILFRLSTLRLL